MDKHVEKLTCKYKDGRSSVALELYLVSMAWNQHMKEQDSYGLHILEQQSMALQKEVQRASRQVLRVKRGYALGCMKATPQPDQNVNIDIDIWNG